MAIPGNVDVWVQLRVLVGRVSVHYGPLSPTPRALCVSGLGMHNAFSLSLLQVRRLASQLPPTDLGIQAPGIRGRGPQEPTLRSGQPRAREGTLGAVGPPPARDTLGEEEDQTVAEHRVPGRRSQDRLQGNGNTGTRKPAVSDIKLALNCDQGTKAGRFFFCCCVESHTRIRVQVPLCHYRRRRVRHNVHVRPSRKRSPQSHHSEGRKKTERRLITADTHTCRK